MELKSERLINNLELNHISPTGGNGWEDGVITFNENTGRVVGIYWMKDRNDIHEEMKNVRYDFCPVMILKDLCSYYPDKENRVLTIFDKETFEYVCLFVEDYHIIQNENLDYNWFYLQ